MALISQSQNIVPVYVKLAYSCTYNTYNLDANDTVTDFIQNIKNSIYSDSIFNISSTTQIEIIQAGQYKQNSKPEEANAVVESDEKAWQCFGKTPAFYVRLGINN